MPENNTQHPTTVRRNWVAKNQWQRGGVHDKPNKAKRQKAKQQLKKAIRSKSAADFLYSDANNFSVQGLPLKTVQQVQRNSITPCREISGITMTYFFSNISGFSTVLA